VQQHVPKSNADQAPNDSVKTTPTGGLERSATRAAKSHITFRAPRHRFTLLDHIEGLEKLLQEAHQRFTAQTQLSLSHAGEWLLDNFYVVQQALRQIREDLPEEFYRQLPKVQIGPPQNCPPRIYLVAREIIRYSQNYLVAEQVQRFVRTYQGIAHLTMGELWALPTMLRLGILEKLAQAVVHIT